MTNAYRSLRITIESKMRHGFPCKRSHRSLSVKSNSISGERLERENIYIMIRLCAHTYGNKKVSGSTEVPE